MTGSLGVMLNESLDRYLQLRIASFFKLFRSTVLYHRPRPTSEAAAAIDA